MEVQALEVAAELRAAGLVLALAEGGLKVSPASKLTPELRETIRRHKVGLIDALAVRRPNPVGQISPRPVSQESQSKNTPLAGGQMHPGGDWTDAEAEAFLARVVHFTSMGLAEADAEALAEKLVHRDREGLDMAACMECSNHAHGRCKRPTLAGLLAEGASATAEVRPIRLLLQRCAGWQDWQGPAKGFRSFQTNL